MVKWSKLGKELSRVPFALWIFVLVYLIFRLMALSREVDSRRDEFKSEIISVCGKVEEASNMFVNLHKTVALESIDAAADLANYASDVAVKALEQLVELMAELLLKLLKMKTSIIRCTVLAGLTVGSDYFIANAQELEVFSNQKIEESISTIEASLDVVRSALTLATGNVESYIDQYNQVAGLISQHNIDLPPLTVDIPTLPPIYFEPVTFPNTTGWQSPDWKALEDQLFELINPLTYIRDKFQLIPKANISAAEIIERMNATEALELTDLAFCARINWTTFDREVDRTIHDLHVAVGVIAVFILMLLCVEVGVVVWNHEKGQFWRPAWYRYDGPLDRFLRHIWHKPSVTCLFVGILGIAILQLLMHGTVVAKESFQRKVIVPIQNFSTAQVEMVVGKLDNTSATFAGLINAEITVLESAFFGIRDDVNSSLQFVTTLQADADAAIRSSVGNVNFAGPTLVEGLQCMADVLDAPVEGIMGLIPLKDGLPRVDERILTFNATRVEAMVDETLEKTLYPYDWYYERLENELVFFYLLACYGTPVLLLGIIFGLADLAKGGGKG